MNNALKPTAQGQRWSLKDLGLGLEQIPCLCRLLKQTVKVGGDDPYRASFLKKTQQVPVERIGPQVIRLQNFSGPLANLDSKVF